MARNSRMAIGVLIAVIFMLALWSLVFISGLKEKEPGRAKLVNLPEIFLNDDIKNKEADMKKKIAEYSLPIDINPDEKELRHLLDFDTAAAIRDAIENKYGEGQRKWTIK